jgi:hypothetical protein
MPGRLRLMAASVTLYYNTDTAQRKPMAVLVSCPQAYRCAAQAPAGDTLAPSAMAQHAGESTPLLLPRRTCSAHAPLAPLPLLLRPPRSPPAVIGRGKAG